MWIVITYRRMISGEKEETGVFGPFFSKETAEAWVTLFEEYKRSKPPGLPHTTNIIQLSDPYSGFQQDTR